MNASERLTLLDNASATGAGVTANLGGRYVFIASGTFGGATLQLQILSPNPAGTVWIDLANGAFTAAPVGVAVDVPYGATMRAALTGGTPSAFYAALVRAPQG